MNEAYSVYKCLTNKGFLMFYKITVLSYEEQLIKLANLSKTNNNKVIWTQLDQKP